MTAVSTREAVELKRTWDTPPGLWQWIISVDHKKVALRYIVTAFLFFALAGIAALLMRIQLARPENQFLSPDRYNQLFTSHGTAMMFLFAVPIMEAMGLYLIPPMIGTRNVAFPRLNNYGYWVYLIGGLLLFGALFVNTGPDAGWFAYAPLSGPEFSPGKRVDIWAQLITFTEIAALVGATEIIVTVFKQRAPGMTLMRMPLFVWAELVMAFMVVFAMPVVATASQMLAMDRLVDTHFFNPAEEGDPLLWQHLFWFFAHPEVYIIFIPALGMISAMLPAFTRRPVFGYKVLVYALIVNGVMSFLLWVHHMFATGMPEWSHAIFTVTSALITIPTAVQLFCWIATIWTGRPRMAVPMLYVVGFFFLFIIGGMSGLFLASVPLDLQLTDTMFLPGHIHYVLLGGAIFPLFGGIYYWFPKATGYLLDDRLGKAGFWLLFLGVNLTFGSMLVLAMLGMPRRVYTYLPGLGFSTPSAVATAGAVLLALGVLSWIVNVVKSLNAGEPAPPDPWGADSLEWTIPSPPPSYNHARIPVAAGRAPAWERLPEDPFVSGLDPSRRLVLVTSVREAEPEARHEQPQANPWPFLTALATGVTFIALIFTPWGLVVGAALAAVGLIAWFWPRKGQPPSYWLRHGREATP